MPQRDNNRFLSPIGRQIIEECEAEGLESTIVEHDIADLDGFGELVGHGESFRVFVAMGCDLEPVCPWLVCNRFATALVGWVLNPLI